MIPIELWAGKSLKTTLLFLYIHFTKKYLIFNKETQAWHQWTNTKWKVVTLKDIYHHIYEFSTQVSIAGSEKLFSSNNYSFINAIKPYVSVEEWPARAGVNVLNGILTVIDTSEENKESKEYCLFKHHPAWFKQEIITANATLDLKPTPVFSLMCLYLYGFRLRSERP